MHTMLMRQSSVKWYSRDNQRQYDNQPVFKNAVVLPCIQRSIPVHRQRIKKLSPLRYKNKPLLLKPDIPVTACITTDSLEHNLCSDR